MEEINPESKNILVWALTGSVLSGTWLAYKLELFKLFSIININDEKNILLPSFLFLFSPFLLSFVFSHYMLPESTGIYIILSAVVSGIMLLTSNSINNKFQLEREKEQRNWQEKNDQQKWYQEKIYTSYTKTLQILTNIIKVRINDPTLSSLNMIELFIEFDSELSLIISGHPDKHSNEFEEKIFEIRKSFEPEPWVGRDTLIEIMEQDSRIKIINNN